MTTCKAHEIDAMLANAAFEVGNDLRTLMIVFRTAQIEGRVLRGAEIKQLEELVFAADRRLDDLQGTMTARLEQYRETTQVGVAAIAEDDELMKRMLFKMREGMEMLIARLDGRSGTGAGPVPGPGGHVKPAPMQPTNVLVFTGSYRPLPANDAVSPGGAA